ncbi:MAG TPA: hypothetical protein VJ694_00130 [Patescibacteria group bacterium]|nr:hypothetical protein [Patescibacteria group bacterium]
MSGTSIWEARCAVLADRLREACAEALRGAEIRILDRSETMLAEEDDPFAPPSYPIGDIYLFRLQERRTRHLFGWARLRYRRWTTVLSFGMEEMWNVTGWATRRGIWCSVYDARVAEAALEVMERFSKAHGIKLGFA